MASEPKSTLAPGGGAKDEAVEDGLEARVQATAEGAGRVGEGAQEEGDTKDQVAGRNADTNARSQVLLLAAGADTEAAAAAAIELPETVQAEAVEAEAVAVVSTQVQAHTHAVSGRAEMARDAQPPASDSWKSMKTDVDEAGGGGGVEAAAAKMSLGATGEMHGVWEQQPHGGAAATNARRSVKSRQKLAPSMPPGMFASAPTPPAPPMQPSVMPSGSGGGLMGWRRVKLCANRKILPRAPAPLLFAAAEKETQGAHSGAPDLRLELRAKLQNRQANYATVMRVIDPHGSGSVEQPSADAAHPRSSADDECEMRGGSRIEVEQRRRKESKHYCDVLRCLVPTGRDAKTRNELLQIVIRYLCDLKYPRTAAAAVPTVSDKGVQDTEIGIVTAPQEACAPQMLVETLSMEPDTLQTESQDAHLRAHEDARRKHIEGEQKRRQQVQILKRQLPSILAGGYAVVLTFGNLSARKNCTMTTCALFSTKTPSVKKMLCSTTRYRPSAS